MGATTRHWAVMVTDENEGPQESKADGLASILIFVGLLTLV